MLFPLALFTQQTVMLTLTDTTTTTTTTATTVAMSMRVDGAEMSSVEAVAVVSWETVAVMVVITGRECYLLYLQRESPVVQPPRHC